MNRKASIDSLVLRYHECSDQRELNTFFDTLDDATTEALVNRLNELFPPEPTVCNSDPFAQRVRMIEQGMSEHEAGFFVALVASGCASRNVQDESCDVCAEFVALHKPDYIP